MTTRPNCGFPEQSHFEALNILFRRMAKKMQSESIGEIYRSQGPLLKMQPPSLKPILEAYKLLLQTAGMEIAQNLSLSEQTKRKLEEPLISTEQYVQHANTFFSECC